MREPDIPLQTGVLFWHVVKPSVRRMRSLRDCRQRQSGIRIYEGGLVKYALTLLVMIGLAFPTPRVSQTEFCPVSEQEASRSPDPSALAEFWLERFELLSDAVASLSPREEQWLQDEVNQSDSQRVARAMRSQEYAIREARRDADNLLSLRLVTGDTVPPVEMPAIMNWSFFVSALLDYDAPVHLARLASEGLVDEAAFPSAWTVLAGGGFPLEESIRAARTNLARHIVVCVIPQVALR